MADEVAKGFGNLPCPRCGENTIIRLCLDNFADSGAFNCCACNAEFGVEEMSDIVNKWTPVLHWLETAPALK